jgi:hypothetical protein
MFTDHCEPMLAQCSLLVELALYLAPNRGSEGFCRPLLRGPGDCNFEFLHITRLS